MIELATVDTLELAPAELAPTGTKAVKKSGYDPLEEEPNFDLIVKARRVPFAKYPHSDMFYGYALEGVYKPPLSQTQADYMAAMLRHAANLIQGAPAARDGDLVISYARSLRIEAKAAVDRWTNLVHKLAQSRNPDVLASELGMDRAHIKKLKKGRFRKPQGLPGIPEKPALKAMG